MIFNKSLVLTEKNKKVIGQLIILLTAFWESSIQFDLVFEQVWIRYRNLLWGFFKNL